MLDLMLDIETWGTQAGCAIRQICVTEFIPEVAASKMSEDSLVGNSVCVNISTDSCIRHGLVLESDTVGFWMHKDRAKVSSELACDVVDLHDALDMVNAFVEKREYGRVWCQGQDFDFPILRSAYLKAMKAYPFPYYKQSDTRTLYHMAELLQDGKVNFYEDVISKIREERAEDLHNARADCLVQIKCVQKAFSLLRYKN